MKYTEPETIEVRASGLKESEFLMKILRIPRLYIVKYRPNTLLYTHTHTYTYRIAEAEEENAFSFLFHIPILGFGFYEFKSLRSSDVYSRRPRFPMREEKFEWMRSPSFSFSLCLSLSLPFPISLFLGGCSSLVRSVFRFSFVVSADFLQHLVKLVIWLYRGRLINSSLFVLFRIQAVLCRRCQQDNWLTSPITVR